MSADGAIQAGVTNIEVPIIDVSGIFSDSLDERKAVATKIGRACEDIGFFVITNHGIQQHVLDNMWRETASFFDRPVEEKLTYIKPQNEYPFGYTKFKGEVLSAGKQAEKLGKEGAATVAAAPDLKEMFSLGPSDPAAGFPTRIFASEPAGFQPAWEEYYESMSALAHKLLRSFSLALELDDELFFDSFVGHHASALRALNYPHLDTAPEPGQIRASAHTDYGTLTILRADAPGLQVSKDKDEPDWHPVPFVPEGLIINLGDLMKRWTNDRWLSTLHRVVNPESGAVGRGWFGADSTRRQSVAFFHNLDKDAVVSNLTPFESKYEPIIAGDFLMQKHLAATEHLEKEKKNEL